MKYYTDELWTNLNSGDKHLAEKASKQWDRNNRLYQKHLNKILPNVPKKAQNFFGKVSLHDGTLLKFSTGDKMKKGRDGDYFIAGSFAEIEVLCPRGTYIYTLSYPVIRKCIVDFHSNSPFLPDKERIYEDWGYHEFSLTKDKWMRHEILFSTGATILLEFKRFSYKRKNSDQFFEEM
jgi:hypothetical protein